MKHKLILLSFVALAVCAGVAWIVCRPTPSIRFVGFAQETYGRVAAFQIVNDSGSPFAVYGYGPASPFYRYRVSTPAGWKEERLGWCGTGAGAHTLAPHSVTELKVSVPHASPAASFAVGVHFHRGTAADLNARGFSRVDEFFLWLRTRIFPSYKGPEPTWSSIAQQP